MCPHHLSRWLKLGYVIVSALSKIKLQLFQVSLFNERGSPLFNNYPADLGNGASSVWNICARFSDVTLREDQWCRLEILAVFSGY